jgi:hypothetical protein
VSDPTVDHDPATSGDVVAFDLRRNLINVLGEEHYPYAEYLYHELVANAWDEDATEVQIVERIVQPAAAGRPQIYDITVSDDGAGMDRGGLQEYFTVGESGKRDRRTSARLGRKLIGRIGVGKVAILKVARRWTIETETAGGPRYRVHVDVDGWIGGTLAAFPIQELPPTGKTGTEIRLEGVRTRLREDRILRHLQRLPLGEGFMVRRNGRLIPPRQWHGIDRIPIETTAVWEEQGTSHEGPIQGEIWIRPEGKGRERAYVEEPTLESDGLLRDPAGIEVRVNNDVIAREFFGHESHGHQVNRIWGWVEADWLPILGNRTGYLHDHPAGAAFRDAVKKYFDDAYNRVRYEKERRAQDRRAAAGKWSPTTTAADETDGAGDDSDEPEMSESDEAWASRLGEGLNRVLRDKPELGPVIPVAKVTKRGRPANDRIYPVRPTGRVVPFERSPYGADVAIEADRERGKVLRAVAGATLRARNGHEELELGDVTVNTAAGIRLRVVPLGLFEGPYRWNLEDPERLTLDINAEHRLYLAAGRPGSLGHRFHLAWVVSVAIAEQMSPGSGRRLADYLETMSSELIDAWGPLRGS